ncbi:MAG TPA: acetate kinase [Longimicrobiales bacterium]|nr:acetate kinase [Longimicrobiales bacterium]
MNVLVLNAGSASLKFQLIRTDQERIANDGDERLARGHIERIGGEALMALEAGGRAPKRSTASLRDHRAAVETVLRWLGEETSVPGISGSRDIDAVGHRVAHGGERFSRSVLIDDTVIHEIEETIDLAPLHNPHNLKGIRAVRDVLGPALPQVAVFDTAFHHTLPERTYLYALPYSLYRRHGVRRYGFHGTSHRYVAYRYRRITGTPRDDTRLITLHLGNGCSACAIMGGNSYDTSMGFTPLEGLVMGTRSGDLDPAILDYIAGKEGMGLHEIEMLLNKQSGLLGISGLTNDMRELLAEAQEHDDRRALLAIDIFCYRIRKYIGAYLAGCGGADAVLFTGGTGENSAEIRRRISDGLEWMGMNLDADANARYVDGAEGRISTDDSRLHAWVIPTDEELLIARDTTRLMLGLEPRY